MTSKSLHTGILAYGDVVPATVVVLLHTGWVCAEGKFLVCSIQEVIGC